MEELKKTVGFVVISELTRANKKFPMFNSPHEGYAVILEEIQEAEQELENLKKKLDCAWYYIRQNNTAVSLEIMKTLKETTILAACETIQVAAMTQKFIDSFKK